MDIRTLIHRTIAVSKRIAIVLAYLKSAEYGVAFFLVVLLAVAQGEPAASAAECSLDEKLSGRIERAINDALGLPAEAVYISRFAPRIFYPWDAFADEDLRAVYGAQMDALPRARAVPEKATTLRSVFQGYQFILSNLELAPNTLYPDALKKLHEIEKKLYLDAQRQVRSNGYQFYLDAKKELEDVERELKDIPLAQLTNAQKTKLSQARKKVLIDADGNIYQSLEAQLAQLDAADLKRWLPQHRAAVDAAGESAISHFPNLGLLINSAAWTQITIDMAQTAAGPCLPAWPTRDGDPSAWRSVAQPPAVALLARNLDQDAIAGQSLQFEIASLAVLRPWYDPSLFESRAWRMPPGLNNYVVARGDEVAALKGALKGQEPAGGPGTKALLPYTPMKVVFARNVRLNGFRKSDADRLWLAAQMRTGASVTFGPFAVGGRLVTTDKVSQLGSSPFTFASISGDSLEFAPPQHIGAVVVQIPAAPSPDPVLWQVKP